jgi:hypothetical protein
MLIKEMICERLFSFPLQYFYKDYPGVGWKPRTRYYPSLFILQSSFYNVFWKNNLRFSSVQSPALFFHGAGQLKSQQEKFCPEHSVFLLTAVFDPI